MRSFVSRFCFALSLFATGIVALPFARSNDTQELIRAVENGLRSPIFVKGEQPVLRTIEDVMVSTGVVGASVAVMRGGKIEWAKGYGVTGSQNISISPSTLFQAASISKAVSALGAMSLVEDGILNLDADVNTTLVSWKIPPSELAQPGEVTLRRLLSHTAGITQVGFPGYSGNATIPTTPQILSGTPPAVNAPVVVDRRPGEEFRYSNGGYVIMQQLMADVTNTSFTEILENRVLGPIGMASSSFQQPLINATDESMVAQPHVITGQAVIGGPLTFPELAAGGIYTTPSDIAMFALALRDAALGNSDCIISQSTAQLMLEPVLSNYGLGVTVNGEGASLQFSHSGGVLGYKSLFVSFVESGDGAVVLTNGDRGAEVFSALFASIAEAYNWPALKAVERETIPLSQEIVQSVAGEWIVTDFGVPFTITGSIDSGLVVDVTAVLGIKEPLHPASANNFFITSQAMELIFDEAVDGVVQTGRVEGPDIHGTFQRVPSNV